MLLWQRLFFGVIVLLAGVPVLAADRPALTREFTPDPAAVQRAGPAYRYPQSGWTVLHIEGDPYERGYQHGTLMATEIADYIQSLATGRSPKAPADGWRDIRLLVNALFLRRYDKEYLEEMKGIADGAAAAGAKFEKRPVDLVDIVAINSGIEVDFLAAGLEAAPTGLEGMRFKEPPYGQPPAEQRDHCSAFAATGPATADGKIVFGHITMWHLYHVRHFSVWLDVKPAKGHRVLMQTFPGGIMSGMDYYMNDAGLLVAETTIRQTRFDANGWSLVSRIRKALQYASGIDEAVEILKKDNNGLYTNEWLMADTKTNEIAMFELGTHKSKLWRSSKNEWFGGTEGFYWGCNNAKDMDVRLETLPSVAGKPANVCYCPSSRDQKWIRLYEKHKGKIAAGFGFEAFTTPPIAAYPSCDAKFTTTALAKELKTWALFGPPLGRTWTPTDSERSRFPAIQPLVSNDWTLLHAKGPAKSDAKLIAVDLKRRPQKESSEEDETPERRRPPAWHGTILPKTDGDTWIAAAFAEYEKIVSLEKSLTARAKDGKLRKDDEDKLALAMFAARSRYLTAVQRFGRDVPLEATGSDFTRDEWYDIAAGKGVLLLAEIRKRMGDKPFEQVMDDFGMANAGRPVAAIQFFEHAEKAYGKPLRDLIASNNGSAERYFWSIDSFAREPESVLIVYGTQKDRHAQRDAAEVLQRNLIRLGNIVIPIKADAEATDEDLKNGHLLVVGRPDSNLVAARVARELPVTFAAGSFVLGGETYAHPQSAIVLAGSNPLNGRYSAVMLAGLSADATWQCAKRFSADERLRTAPVLLMAAGRPAKAMAVNAMGTSSKRNGEVR